MGNYYFRKTVLVIVHLDDGENVGDIARAVRTSFSHVGRILGRLEADGVVVIERKGREKIVRLTEKGRKVKTLFEELFRLLGIGSREDQRSR